MTNCRLEVPFSPLSSVSLQFFHLLTGAVGTRVRFGMVAEADESDFASSKDIFCFERTDKLSH